MLTLYSNLLYSTPLYSTFYSLLYSTLLYSTLYSTLLFTLLYSIRVATKGFLRGPQGPVDSQGPNTPEMGTQTKKVSSGPPSEQCLEWPWRVESSMTIWSGQRTVSTEQRWMSASVDPVRTRGITSAHPVLTIRQPSAGPVLTQRRLSAHPVLTQCSPSADPSLIWC
jgi:hypothetical protein